MIKGLPQLFEKETVNHLLNRIKKYGQATQFPGAPPSLNGKYANELSPRSNSPLSVGMTFTGMPRNTTVAYTCMNCQQTRRLTPLQLSFAENAMAPNEFQARLRQLAESFGNFGSLSWATRYEKRVEFGVITHETVAHSMWKTDFGLFVSYCLTSAPSGKI